jgi:hypothetical protein
VDALHNIKRKKYKTVCAELAFDKITFDRMVMVFYRTLFAIGSWIIAISKGFVQLFPLLKQFSGIKKYNL